MAEDEEIRELVLCRLKTMPKNIKVSLGSHGELNRDDLIKHVESGDELGKLIVGMQLQYLKSMKGF